ncbi:hypothetical protein [Nonomuraea sp. NPDC049400]|uniref:hypothetical protein n=1 Tax=Nonomuraea sp. NPDC049400 TaxID=3364352 RepID=UPI0037A35492
MTTIIPSAPEQIDVTPEIDKHATLALACYLFGPEQGSHLLRRVLLASILVDRHGLPPTEAIDRAMNGCDWFTLEAGDEKDRLIDQARRAVLAAEQDSEVSA